MIVRVLMLAFGTPGQVREVQIPDHNATTEQDILDATFYWGQNDFQPVDGCPSVSAGDVIELHGKHFAVARSGFEELSDEALATYMLMPQRERSFYFYTFGHKD